MASAFLWVWGVSLNGNGRRNKGKHSRQLNRTNAVNVGGESDISFRSADGNTQSEGEVEDSFS